jgi:hypothetical protein
MNYLQLYVSLGLQMGYIAKFTNRLGVVDVGQVGIGHSWIGRFFAQCKRLLTSVYVRFQFMSQKAGVIFSCLRAVKIRFEVEPDEPHYICFGELLWLKPRPASLLPGTTT